MAVVVHRPDAIDAFLLQSHPVEPDRSQAHPVPDDTQMLDPFAARQGGTQVHGSLHDPVCQVRIELRFPVSLLETASENRTTA